MRKKSVTRRYYLVKLATCEFYEQSVSGRPDYSTGTAKLKEITYFAVYGLVAVGVYSSVVKRIQTYLNSVRRKAVCSSQFCGLSLDIDEHKLFVCSLKPTYAMFI